MDEEGSDCFASRGQVGIEPKIKAHQTSDSREGGEEPPPLLRASVHGLRIM